MSLIFRDVVCRQYGEPSEEVVEGRLISVDSRLSEGPSNTEVLGLADFWEKVNFVVGAVWTHLEYRRMAAKSVSTTGIY